jgi:hypothetical protein
MFVCFEGPIVGRSGGAAARPSFSIAKGASVRALGLFGLVLLLLLPACGAQKSDPVAEVASAGDSQGFAQAGLASMVVSAEYVGGLPRMRVSSDSGWTDNRAEAQSTFDPDDSAQSLTKAGRLTGYALYYNDPLRRARRSGGGVEELATWVELFSSAKAASAYLRYRTEYARGVAGRSPHAGVTFEYVTPFDPGMSAPDAVGLRESVLFGGDRVFRTRIGFRRGNVVAGVIIARADEQGGVDDALRVAGILDMQVQTALRGGKNSEPVPIPQRVSLSDEPSPEPPPGAPDLAAIALGPDDLPPGIPCNPGSYTHTTPPRITFRRSFCPRGAKLGHTSLGSLASEVSVYDSAAVAKVALPLTVRSLLSPAGIEGFAANFADSSGLLPTNIRTRQLNLKGGGIGLLTTFNTDDGPMVDFFALARRGRALTTLDAIGPAQGFDHQDMVPYLHTVERRLRTLG